ncbi:ArnT family glycosyltransferase [Fretibacter rubidus]|uniref:ArnT family glycosyltransferase n=1 Tax=Fretibacter rubidus TaxID=570162 RepID=UPI00352A206E
MTSDTTPPSKASKRRTHSVHAVLLTLLTLLMAVPGIWNLPVIDRDEARFAVASVQMAESGDYVSIRFQDEARNKKPVGSYWAQTGFIKAFSKDGERRIWAQRIPSVLAAIIAVLATYWAGVAMIGRRGAFVAGGLLAVSALFVFEAHIAKTDALLCAMGALVFMSFALLRQGGGRLYALVFWVALGLAVMIKGPVIPGVAGLTLITLAIWERQNAWMRTLLFWPGPILFLLIILPWSIMIYQATEGQFFKDALVGDFGQKLVSGQEKHGAPPGAYLLSLPVAFWPSVLFLIPGFAFAIRAVRRGLENINPVVRAMRLALAWAIPYWIILEIIPTKLPNYLLPVYSAFAVMCAGAILTLFAVKEFKISRIISAVLIGLVSTALIAGILIGEAVYGPLPTWSFGFNFAALLAVVFSCVMLGMGRAKKAVIGVIAGGILLYPFLYAVLLPSLSELRLADRVEAEFNQNNITLPRKGGPQVLAYNFTEPSLVYRLGSDIVLGDRIKLDTPLLIDTVILTDSMKSETDAFLQAVSESGNCTAPISTIKGHNYSKGNAVSLDLVQVIPCPLEPQGEPDTEPQN